jgi:peptidyl-prolyl cis-trans isomerase A (cyclophilin A)
MKMLLAAALLLVTVLAGCAEPATTSTSSGTLDAANDGVRVLFVTSLGNFTVQMMAAHAPQTVANFLAYVDSHYFEKLTFHRIAPGFVVQGGGYESDYKTRHTARAPIPLEATGAEPNKQWTLSMARTGDPNSATSEFFVNLQDNKNLDPTGPNTGYAVFGKVVSGFDTITAMTKVEAGASFGAGGFYPKVPIVIQSATRVA